MEDEIRRTRAKKKYLRVTFPNGEEIWTVAIYSCDK